MSKVEKTTYAGWDNYPVYSCRDMDDWSEISEWMYKNGCKPFLLSSGSSRYVFQVRENYDWFVLRWS